MAFDAEVLHAEIVREFRGLETVTVGGELEIARPAPRTSSGMGAAWLRARGEEAWSADTDPIWRASDDAKQAARDRESVRASRPAVRASRARYAVEYRQRPDVRARRQADTERRRRERFAALCGGET